MPAGAIGASVRRHRHGIIGTEPEDERAIMVYLFR
jgi:hypothetical protein